MTTTQTRTTLVTELNLLHAAYVHQINVAVEDGDQAAVAELSTAYHRESLELVASWEGKEHLLRADSTQTDPLARRVARLAASAA